MLLWSKDESRTEEPEENPVVPRETYLQCRSRWDKRSRRIHTGKQTYRCKVCGRAFVLTLENLILTAELGALIVYRRVVQDGLRTSPSRANARHASGASAAARNRTRRAWELCKEESESTLGLDCHGRPNSSNLHLLCRGPQWSERRSLLEKNSCRVEAGEGI